MPPAKIVRRNLLNEFRKSRFPSSKKSIVHVVKKRRLAGNTPIKRQYLKRSGAVASNSSGFIKRGRRVKRKFKRRSVRRIFKGVERTYEFGNTVQSQYTAYLGHATCPPAVLMRITLEAMLKQLMMRAGGIFASLRETIVGTAANDRIDFTFRHAPDQALQDGFITFNGALSIQDIASFMMLNDVFRYNNNPSNTGAYMGDIEFHRFSYNPIEGSQLRKSQINTQQYVVDLHCKSTLKIQNRSVNTGNDDDADDVDNVPLYGKTYEGSGLGTPFTSDIAQGVPNPQPLYYKNFYGGTYDGVIYRSGDVIEELREPVRAQQFAKVKLGGKARLEPGHIKTSKLQFHKKFYFNTIMNLVIKLIGQRLPDNGESAAPQQYLPFVPGYTQRHLGQLFFPGKFRFIGFEKIMEAQSDNPVSMTLAFEHNLNISAMCVSKFTTITAPGYESALAQVVANQVTP